MIIVRTTANSRDAFIDFAKLSFRLYLDKYDKTLDLSLNLTSNDTTDTSDDSSESTTSNDSIFGTYSLYFNAQSA